MLQPRTFRDSNIGMVHGFEADANDIAAWKPVVTQVRQCILDRAITGTGTLKGGVGFARFQQFCPSQRDVETASDMALEAAIAGRLIDFGDWTQDVIIYGGNRGGPLYGQGMISHPFREPYVFMHTWDGETAIYLVNPVLPDEVACDCEVLELQPMVIGGNRLLMIADRVLLSPSATEDKLDWKKYHCYAVPSVFRVMYDKENPAINMGKTPEGAAAGNVLDPLMTGLLILSTRGIARDRVETPPKLAKARIKNGKPPIPPYDRVNSAPYVTAISLRKARGRKMDGQGGHHASPVMHLRMGHLREYANGTRTFVRDALVNATAEARAAWAGNRSHYTVKG